MTKRLHVYYLKWGTFVDLWEKDYTLANSANDTAKNHGLTLEGFIENALQKFGIKVGHITTGMERRAREARLNMKVDLIGKDTTKLRSDNKKLYQRVENHRKKERKKTSASIGISDFYTAQTGKVYKPELAEKKKCNATHNSSHWRHLKAEKELRAKLFTFFDRNNQTFDGMFGKDKNLYKTVGNRARYFCEPKVYLAQLAEEFRAFNNAVASIPTDITFSRLFKGSLEMDR